MCRALPTDAGQRVWQVPRTLHNKISTQDSGQHPRKPTTRHMGSAVGGNLSGMSPSSPQRGPATDSWWMTKWNNTGLLQTSWGRWLRSDGLHILHDVRCNDTSFQRLEKNIEKITGWKGRSLYRCLRTVFKSTSSFYWCSNTSSASAVWHLAKQTHWAFVPSSMKQRFYLLQNKIMNVKAIWKYWNCYQSQRRLLWFALYLT